MGRIGKKARKIGKNTCLNFGKWELSKSNGLLYMQRTTANKTIIIMVNKDGAAELLFSKKNKKNKMKLKKVILSATGELVH